MLNFINSFQGKANNIVKSILYNVIVAKVACLIGKFLGLINLSSPSHIASIFSIIAVIIVGGIIIKYLIKVFKNIVNKMFCRDSSTVKNNSLKASSSKSSKEN